MSGRIHFPMLVPPVDEGGIAVGVTGYAFRVVYLQGGHEEPFVKNGRDVEYLVLAILVSGAYSDPFFQRGEGLVVQAEFIIHAALYLQGHRHAYRLFNLLRRLEHGCGFLTGLVEPSLLEQSGYISSYWGNEDKGARRRYYTITEQGKNVYEQNKKDWEEAKNLIDTLIGEER